MVKLYRLETTVDDHGSNLAVGRWRYVEVEGHEECVATVTEDYGYAHPCGEHIDAEAHHPDFGHEYEPGWIVPLPPTEET